MKDRTILLGSQVVVVLRITNLLPMSGLSLNNGFTLPVVSGKRSLKGNDVWHPDRISKGQKRAYCTGEIKNEIA